jgi:carboxylesterase type B
VRFAASGDPNGGGLPAWPSSDAREQYLELDATMRVGTGRRQAQLDFLDQYFGGPAGLRR